MQVLGNLFYIVLFLTAMGGAVSFIALFMKNVFHVSLPLWYGAFGVVFFLLPVIVPQVQLIAGENQLWHQGFYTASKFWLIGVIVFAIYFIVRTIMAAGALRKYALYQDERIHQVLHESCSALKIKKVPKIFEAQLETPVCVVTVMTPVILMNKKIADQLTEKELHIILRHELMHIKRGHHLLQRLYEIAAIINWFNPFIWISKSDFELICEMDCDKHTLSTPGIHSNDYAATMLRLMELSAQNKKNVTGSLGALGFLLAKQRFGAILKQPTKLQRSIVIAVLATLIFGMIVLSGITSRTYFYPYPAFDAAPEYNTYTP